METGGTDLVLLTVCACTHQQSRSFKLWLIDWYSGAEQSFIDSTLTVKINLPLEWLSTALQVRAQDGSVLLEISQRTQLNKLTLSGSHSETIQLYLFSSPYSPLVQSDPPNLSLVPRVYHDLAKVFCKDLNVSLPPHCPYDCAIDRLPVAPFPFGRSI